MTRPSDVGGFNILGLKQVTVDRAFEEGIFSGLTADEQTEARSLFAQIAMTDPVSRTVGFSTVRGVYEGASGRIIDTTALSVASQKMAKTLSQDVALPFVRFNPLQMLGVGGPRRMDPAQEMQFVPAISRQDFLGGAGENAKVFAWVKERGGLFGSVGRLFAVGESSTGGEGVVEQVPGLFKAISSIDTDIYARATRLATNRQQYRDSELTGEPLSRSERIRSAFDIDEEQPNSLARRFGRFLGRKTDIRNESTLAELIATGEIRLRGGRALILSSTDDGLQNVVDEAGEEIFNPDQLAEALEDFRISAQGKGTAARAMEGIEEALGIGPYINEAGESIGRVSSLSGNDLIKAAELSLQRFGNLQATLRGRGIDVTGLSRSARTLERIAAESDAVSTYVATSSTSTITTRQEYLRNIIHRFNVEMAAYDLHGGNPIEITKTIEQTLKRLRDTGQISATQLTEARAAALGTVFNLSAFRSYAADAQRGRIASRSLNFLMGEKSRDSAFGNALSNLLSPFRNQTIANVNSQGAGRYLNTIRPLIKRNFGIAPYELSPNAVNPLGNIGTTFVPTFSSVLDRAARGDVSFSRVAGNVLGITSYRDPDTYSTASIPGIHLSERLNRYFESVGLGLQHENYAGPLDAFFRGYGIKRVLPLVAAGTVLATADRTIGGLVNEKDQRGERVYSPFFGTKIARGAVEAQSILS